MEFIGGGDFDRCVAYEAQGYEAEAKVAGMDVARFGDDQNAIYMRQGRKTVFLKKWRGLDTQQSAAHLVELDQAHNFDAIFIDGGGPGGGVIDRARVLLGDERVIEVNFGSSARNETRWANKRAEMWGSLRDAMRAGLEIEDIPELRADLTGPLYSFTNGQQILLEKKETMKKRGLASPDLADALALTFAEPVIRNNSGPPIPPGFVSPFRQSMGIA
jgi:phage terminase large subunit